jgi:hypothetical protein
MGMESGIRKAYSGTRIQGQKGTGSQIRICNTGPVSILAITSRTLVYRLFWIGLEIVGFCSA